MIAPEYAFLIGIAFGAIAYRSIFRRKIQDGFRELIDRANELNWRSGKIDEQLSKKSAEIDEREAALKALEEKLRR